MYSNSDCKFSAYAGPSYTRKFYGQWRAGVALLGLTGYEKKTKEGLEDKLLLAPVLVLAYEGKKRGLNIGYIPPGGDFKGLAFVQAKVLRW